MIYYILMEGHVWTKVSYWMKCTSVGTEELYSSSILWLEVEGFDSTPSHPLVRTWQPLPDLSLAPGHLICQACSATSGYTKSRNHLLEQGH